MSGVYKWSAIDRVCNSVMTFAGNIILARILTPYDFGLLAMVAIFVAIAYNISGCGLSDGLIKKTNPTDKDYSTVFVFNLAFGLFFCVIFILLFIVSLISVTIYGQTIVLKGVLELIMNAVDAIKK